MTSMRLPYDPVVSAKIGMFGTADKIDTARGDAVAVANLRTDMCDYRLALSLALGRDCDRNGYTSEVPEWVRRKRGNQ